MFEGFTHKTVRTSGAEISLTQGGRGSPLLLVHGCPQTHAIWHKVAPELAKRFTVIAPDLRGYGASSKPHGDPNHLSYSKRAMAQDLVELLAALGFKQFDIAGHDRGGRVAYRLALDHPERVRRIAVLDIIPTLEQFERMNRFTARAGYHWYFLAQPEPFPENLIGKDPDYFLNYSLESWCQTPGAFSAEALAEYREAFRDPATIHAICEDYRAGIGCDCDLDAADRSAGRKITAPLLAMWGAKGIPQLRNRYEMGTSVIDIWRGWAEDVRGCGIDSGHFIPEENPAAVIEQFIGFFA
jgi:haloacetate dehalogenase